MASTSSQKPFPSISSTRRWKYDVFLSFRGPDTRKNFTDYLYTALNQKGVHTFRDDEELERGNGISSGLLKAIEDSRFSIIVLSKNYASSTWCLEELSTIVDRVNTGEHTAFPVFYYVDPSDVRYQTGDFKKYFDKHEVDLRDDKENKVQRWREALTQVGNSAGWHLHDRHESELVQKIVDEVCGRLNQLCPSIDGDFIGIDSSVKKLIEYVNQVYDDGVGFIGITGMGGIGKTTIARVVYDRLSSQYDGSSFLSDVREVSEGNKGLVHLQEQLLCTVLNVTNFNIRNVHDGINLISKKLCHKKVFLVLDDVDKSEQLKWLARNRNWFGYGSRVVITTRDEHLLIRHGINNIYKVGELRHDDSIKLLHSKAFKQKQPTGDHLELSNRVVKYTNGLPLALEVLGSHLCDRIAKEWRSVLNRLKEAPDKEIFEVLRVSYDGLDDMEKEIFLDIACFFKGKDKDLIMEILDSCGFGPDIGVSCLIEKSVISISNNRVLMHDLLQEMGWQIVREQHPKKPGKWTRLWRSEDIYNVLTKDMATEAIEGIVLDMPKSGIMYMNGKSFSSMKSLRLLKISKVHLFEDLEYLSNELRVLKWSGYPSDSLPLSFESEKLIKLNMCHSNIEYLWIDMKSFKKLRTIKLRHCHNLIKTPDFRNVPALERLDLEGCTSLLEVHESVAALKKLIVLNLKDCKSLVKFPGNICGMKSLNIFNLSGCTKIDNLPQNLGEVKCLEELDISGTGIRKVPCSIVVLNNLKILSGRGCKGEPQKTWSSSLFSWWLPKRNPNSMCLELPPLTGLSSLRKLDLSDCNFSEGSNLDDICNLTSLEELDLSRNNFASLPASIKQLSKLQIFSLEGCKSLQSLPELPPKISLFGVEDCSSLETLMTALEENTAPEMKLNFFNCFKLVENEERENNLAVMLLKHRLQRLSSHTFRFGVLLHGSEIPDWFSHHSDTTSITVLKSITIPLHRNWLNDEFLGLVVFALFAHPLPGSTINYGFKITTDDEDSFYFDIPVHGTMNSDHLSLGYMSRKLFETKIKQPNNCTTLRAYFLGLSYLLKRIGMRLVYKQDLDVHHNLEESPAAGDSNAGIVL